MLTKSKDYDIRAAVVRWLLANGFKREQIRHEITMDTASAGGRCDMLLLATNALIAVEIKSGSDKLDRLKDQETAGEMAADYFWLFADMRHKKDLPYTRTRFLVDGQKIMNDYANQEATLVWSNGIPYENKWGGGRSTTTTPRRMASLLWKSETDWLALACEIPKGSRCKVIAAIQEQESLSSIRSIVTDLLRKRKLSKWEESFWVRFDAEAVASEAAE